jgi:MinD-like ATPase involved in chromosome partitioning or flagellar assembly
MNGVITIHSFRRGVGRSTLAANLAGLLAQGGQRIALLDTDFQAPGVHSFFNLSEGEITNPLNEYLWGEGDIRTSAINVTSHLGADIQGQLILVPASSKMNEIMRSLRHSYSFERLNAGIDQLIKVFDLDFLILDTLAGVNEDTLTAMALSQKLVVLLRPDQGDYQGTAVTVEIARNFEVLGLFLVLNDAPDDLDITTARRQLEESYQCEVGALLPHSESIMSLASAGLLSTRRPDDPYIVALKGLALKLTQ